MEVHIQDDPFGFDFAAIPDVPYPGLSKLVEEGLVDKFEPVGSRVTCNPAPTGTDEDWLVLTSKYLKLVSRLSNAYGFDRGGSEVEDEDDSHFGFSSLKLGEINLIVTGNEKFYSRFLAASSVAKRLNLLDKSDRIALFDAVIHGKACQPKEVG